MNRTTYVLLLVLLVISSCYAEQFFTIEEMRHFREYDHHVYLILTNGLHGWCLPQTDSAWLFLAIHKDIPRQIEVKFSSYDPNWGHDHSGFFYDVRFQLK